MGAPGSGGEIKSRQECVGAAAAKLVGVVSNMAKAMERIMGQDIAKGYLPGVASRCIRPDLDSLHQVRAKCLELGEGPDQAFHLAVLGEAGVGKSSLINALLRQPVALVDQVKPIPFVCSYRAVTSCDLEGATIQHRDGRKEEQSIAAARRLLEDGSTDEDLLSSVDRLEFRVHAQMTTPLCLYDMPGSGGSTYNEETASSLLERVHGVLWVFDATRIEQARVLPILQELRGQGKLVVGIINRRDEVDPAAVSRALTHILHAYPTQFSAVLSVSAHLGAARAAGREEDDDGMAQLRDYLRKRASSRGEEPPGRDVTGGDALVASEHAVAIAESWLRKQEGRISLALRECERFDGVARRTSDSMKNYVNTYTADTYLKEEETAICTRLDREDPGKFTKEPALRERIVRAVVTQEAEKDGIERLVGDLNQLYRTDWEREIKERRQEVETLAQSGDMVRRGGGDDLTTGVDPTLLLKIDRGSASGAGAVSGFAVMGYLAWFSTGAETSALLRIDVLGPEMVPALATQLPLAALPALLTKVSGKRDPADEVRQRVRMWFGEVRRRFLEGCKDKLFPKIEEANSRTTSEIQESLKEAMLSGIPLEEFKALLDTVGDCHRACREVRETLRQFTPQLVRAGDSGVDSDRIVLSGDDESSARQALGRLLSHARSVVKLCDGDLSPENIDLLRSVPGESPILLLTWGIRYRSASEQARFNAALESIRESRTGRVAVRVLDVDEYARTAASEAEGLVLTGRQAFRLKSSLRAVGQREIEVVREEESRRLEEEVFDPLWEGVADGRVIGYQEL
jgi:ribosome biogenesis GTPase A